MFDDAGLLRYSRHILLDDIGIEGQERIALGKVLVIGAGGLGSPASLYLCAAGLGYLHLSDHDTVDLTNLQRQVALASADVGQQKVLATQNRLQTLNPFTQVIPYSFKADPAWLSERVPQMDVLRFALRGRFQYLILVLMMHPATNACFLNRSKPKKCAVQRWAYFLRSQESLVLSKPQRH